MLRKAGECKKKPIRAKHEFFYTPYGGCWILTHIPLGGVSDKFHNLVDTPKQVFYAGIESWAVLRKAGECKKKPIRAKRGIFLYPLGGCWILIHTPLGGVRQIS